MAEKKKLSVAEILAAARKKDGGAADAGASAAGEPPTPPAPATDAAPEPVGSEPLAETAAEAPAPAPSKPASTGTPGKRPSIAEIMAAARQKQAPGAAAPAAAKPAAAKPTPKPAGDKPAAKPAAAAGEAVPVAVLAPGHGAAVARDGRAQPQDADGAVRGEGGLADGVVDPGVGPALVLEQGRLRLAVGQPGPGRGETGRLDPGAAGEAGLGRRVGAGRRLKPEGRPVDRGAGGHSRREQRRQGEPAAPQGRATRQPGLKRPRPRAWPSP